MQGIYWSVDTKPEDVRAVCGKYISGYGSLGELGADEDAPLHPLRNDIVVLRLEGEPFCVPVGAEASRESTEVRVVAVDGNGAGEAVIPSVQVAEHHTED